MLDAVDVVVFNLGLASAEKVPRGTDDCAILLLSVSR